MRRARPTSSNKKEETNRPAGASLPGSRTKGGLWNKKKNNNHHNQRKTKTSSPFQQLRFGVGDQIMCNCSEGWTLGRVIALDYREDHWPKSAPTAPYQVMLEEYDRRLIYVPFDDDRVCRKPTPEDLNIFGRLDALAASVSTATTATNPSKNVVANANLTSKPLGDGVSGYRDGRCECCDSCPRSWSAVELYSEHYRAATRNGLPITRHSVDLGTVRVGTILQHSPEKTKPPRLPSSGFLQCPTLPRLPPGVVFEDDGSLSGPVKFDPHREDTYAVNFVAVSTAEWERPSVGLVRLEITFAVVENVPPDDFDASEFQQEQRTARAMGEQILASIYETWGGWEKNTLDNPQTIQQMTTALYMLRNLLEQHPRLDGGMWWAQLGGYHMNVHKLLENKLFECELYLGQALLFDDAQVRRAAERNLEGCYKKRILETARFLWMDGLDQILKGEWSAAAETLRLAAGKKDGWGWGVNSGDIWISEAAARVLYGAKLAMNGNPDEGQGQIDEADRLLTKAKARFEKSLGREGHPWATDICQALAEYHGLDNHDGAAMASWADSFKSRTMIWCAQVFQGTSPFPPKVRPRTDDAEALRRRLPGHNR